MAAPGGPADAGRFPAATRQRRPGKAGRGNGIEPGPRTPRWFVGPAGDEGKRAELVGPAGDEGNRAELGPTGAAGRSVLGGAGLAGSRSALVGWSADGDRGGRGCTERATLGRAGELGKCRVGMFPAEPGKGVGVDGPGLAAGSPGGGATGNRAVSRRGKARIVGDFRRTPDCAKNGHSASSSSPQAP